MGECAAITVVRLPCAPHQSPPERIISTVGRVDLALADALHNADATRPYAVARRLAGLDVVCGTDALARALLAGEPGAKLVCRVPVAGLAGDGGRTIRLAFTSPTLFRVAGYDHLLPDSASVFGSLRTRWEALGWPALPRVETLLRIPVWPEELRFAAVPSADGRPQRGFIGAVRFEVDRLPEADRSVLWTLARFGQYRGVGRLTSYGLGRCRLLAAGEHWRWGDDRAAWAP